MIMVSIYSRSLDEEGVCACFSIRVRMCACECVGGSGQRKERESQKGVDVVSHVCTRHAG